MLGNTFNILCSSPWIPGPAPENGKPPLPPKSFSTPTSDRGFTGPSVLIGTIQFLCHVWLFVIACMAIEQAPLPFTILCSFPKLMSIESVMPSYHLIFLVPFLLPTIFPSIRVPSNELTIHIRWCKCWASSSASVLPLNIDLPLSKQNSCFQSSNKFEHW